MDDHKEPPILFGSPKTRLITRQMRSLSVNKQAQLNESAFLSAKVPGNEKQVNILHYFGGIPTLSDTGDAVMRSGNRVDLIETVKRISRLLPQFLYETPLYGYELLDKAFQSKCKFKLENMQRFGDSTTRSIASIILSNYFSQQDRLPKDISEVKGMVLVLNSHAIHLDTIAAFKVWPIQTIVVCPNSNLTLLQLTQLFTCYKTGSQIIFHDGNTAACEKKAAEIAKEKQYIYIDNQFSTQYFLIGQATLAYEILTEKRDTQVLIVPVRKYEIGQFAVAGIAAVAKMMKPSVQIVLSTFQDAEVSQNPDDVVSQGLFPDPLSIGWKRNLSKFANPRIIFDELDASNHGFVTDEELRVFLSSIGAPVSIEVTSLQKRKLNISQFIGHVNEEYLASWNHAVAQNKSLQKFMSLDSLKTKGFIDQIVVISEDEAATAFVRCLEYTHTLADLLGALPMAALWSKKVDPKEKKVVGIISGGFVDVMNFQTILDYSMGLEGSHFSLNLELPDNATSLSKVLSLLGEHGISVRDVNFDRTGLAPLYFVRVIIQCLSKSFQQQADLETVLIAKGYRFTFGSPSHQQSQPRTSLSHSASISTQQPNLKLELSGPEIPPIRPRKVRDINEITPESIRVAAKRIEIDMLKTPLYFDQAYSDLCGCKIYLKFDNIQKTGSFKIRGSSNMVRKVIDELHERPKGLVAASAGNHAQGVALTSSKFNLPCTIVCPVFAPESKLKWTRGYGAEVLKIGNSLEEAMKAAEQICRERDWLFVRPFNDVDIIEGQGTIGYEIHQSAPDIDTVLVNVGGGGMIAGIALYLKKVNPNIRIVGIQSEVVAPLIDFKKTEALKYMAPTTTLADGVNVRVPGGVHSKVLHDLVDEFVTVSENEIASTIVNLLSSSRTLSEGAGCLGLAALLHKKIHVRPDEKVCVVLCGGNIDMSVLQQIYEYGLRSLGRFFTIQVTTSDAPGNLASIIAVAAQMELTVHEVRHIRGVGDIKWNEVTLSISFYSNSFKHQRLFLSALVDVGKFPVVTGREMVKNHAEIYELFDKKVVQKKKELEQTSLEKQEQFLAEQGTKITRLNSGIL